ncbi:MAG: hypothetical protein J6575_03455 [Bifidobacterium sp.]|nr:hypothetical protein [Bifidobacterium sp.]
MTVRQVEGLHIDGLSLDQLGLALAEGGVDLGEPETFISLNPVPGAYNPPDLTLVDGLGNAYTGTRTITIPCVSLIDQEEDSSAIKSKVGQYQGRSVRVTWRTLPGAWVGRLKVGKWQDFRSEHRLAYSTIDLTLTCDPLLHGPKTIQNLNQGNNTVRVHGNRETWPTLTLTPTPGARGLSVSCGGASVRIPEGPVNMSGIVVMDCLKREVRSNDSLMRITLDSDWFNLKPKTTDVCCRNCSGTISFEPLTMI